MIAERTWPFLDPCLLNNPSALTLKSTEDGPSISTSATRKFSTQITTSTWKHTTRKIRFHLTATTVRTWYIAGWTNTYSPNNGNRCCRWSRGRIGSCVSSIRRRRGSEIYGFVNIIISYLSTLDCCIYEKRCWFRMAFL